MLLSGFVPLKLFIDIKKYLAATARKNQKINTSHSLPWVDAVLELHSNLANLNGENTSLDQPLMSHTACLL